MISYEGTALSIAVKMIEYFMISESRTVPIDIQSELGGQRIQSCALGVLVRRMIFVE